MLRKIVAPTTCCLLLSCGVLAAPRKEVPPPVYYVPSAVGDTLVYEQKEGDQSWDYVVEVTEARQKGAALVVTARVTEDDGTSRPGQHEVSDTGVYRAGAGDTALESPECYLRLPFKKGETWETAYTHEGEGVTVKCIVAGEEEVEVPAGKFRCIRIESEFVFNGASFTRSRWRAPRCGMVKEVVVGRDGERTVYARTTVLKSFAPGGK